MTQKAAKTRFFGTKAMDGVVLLEVILALTLFVFSAAVISGAMSASIRAARELRIAALAEDLAVTKQSELLMGLEDVVDSGPNTYQDDDRLTDWTWQVVTTAADEVVITPGLAEKRVEVIIRNGESGFTYRLATLMPSAGPDIGTSASSMTTGGIGP